MKPFPIASSSRSALLRLRCAEQREQFMDTLADIEAKLQRADAGIDTVRRFFTKPAVIAGGMLLMLLAKRAGGKQSGGKWKWLSRGLLLMGTVRRLFRTLRSSR